MCSKLVYLASVILLLAVATPQCWAVVGPVTAIETSNPPGSPPYDVVSITAGGYTVTADQLVTGTSTHGGIGGTPTPELDDFDINTALNWNLGGGDFWTVDFGGGLWKDLNGDNPDFFLFEYGGSETPAVAAIMPDGTLGRTVTIPEQWVDLGYTRDGAAAGDAVSGSGTGQSLEGMSWSITDLLDAGGNPLTNDSVIKGISIVNRNGVDPVGFFAIRPAAIVIAHSPVPADGALHEDTWINVSWSAGKGAASHDVYLAENFDDVNDRTADAFRGNQPLDFIVVGFPGFAYPDGLVAGTTYYWRVDEIEADGTLHAGDVWSFSIPSKKAVDPIPVDGAYFVETDVTLVWSEGLGTKLHHLYFGESFDEVDKGTGDTYKGPMGTMSYEPGSLQMEKTYYWRVDEFDAVETHKGDVWSFTTTRPGLGNAVMERWENITGTDLNTLKDNPSFPNSPDVTETVTSFEWDGPDTDDYGGRIEAWLYVPAAGDYTFWLATDDNGELWLSTDDDSSNAELIATVPGYSGLNDWTKFSSQKSASIPLTGGEKYYIAALWKEGGGGDHCQVAWEGPGIATQTIIPGTNLSPFEPMSAFGAMPTNRAVGVTQTPVLRWKPGLEAVSHEVYFGTDPDAVANATGSSPQYVGARQLGDESYEPAMLAWETTYYWRVDEVNTANAESPWTGKVWSFTTADFGIVDDFESYNDIPTGEPGSNLVYETWLDGFGITTNGSTMGYTVPFEPTMENTVVHGGDKSAPLAYDNTSAASSEITRTFASQDWTDNAVQTLSLWFFGDPANSPGQLYVRINGVNVDYTGDSADLTRPAWQQWNIDLASVGANLQSVTSLAIGVGGVGAEGTLLIDDIGLYQSVPESPAQLYFEAEAADSITPPMKTYADPMASGGRYIGTDDGIGDENNAPPADGVATYSFTAEAGTYRISLRIKPDAGNSVWVRIPGATGYDPGTHGSGWIRFNGMEAGPDWHWDEVHSDDHGQQVVRVTLPAGSHTLEIAYREDGGLIDAILIAEDVD